MAIIRSLCDEAGENGAGPAAGKHADRQRDRQQSLIETIARYFALIRDPVEAKVMRPLILKEIHFRLLTGQSRRHAPAADAARQPCQPDFARHRPDTDGLSQPAHRGQLSSDEAGMSPSSFHEHFKQITGTTPLQYQKDMRLMEAQRLISTDGFSVSSAAFEVGYESATQFSREYSRKFGNAPRDDVYRPGSRSEQRSSRG
jgi:AraC-like DNA-binding protein